MSDRCHWVYEKGVGRVHIPGCMGAAVYGPNGCTCRPASGEKKEAQLEARIAVLETRLEAIAAIRQGEQ